MGDDATQGLLFGTSPTPVVADSLAEHHLRLCTLNCHSPGSGRAQPLVDWFIASARNVLVLTELRPTDGARHLLASLDADGFTISRTPGWSTAPFFTAIASKGFDVGAVEPPFDPRVVTVDLATTTAPVRLVGVYAPTNGMTADSGTRRNAFQQRLLTYLQAIDHPALCLAGDLNVVEPDHQPALVGFADHDYAFYTALLGLGLRDAYRLYQPDGSDHSWYGPRHGAQRLDHVLVSARVGDLTECHYDHNPRTTGLSDHAALLATVAFTP